MKLYEELNRIQELSGISLTEEAKAFKEILNWADKTFDQKLKAPGVIPLPAWKKLIAADDTIDAAIKKDDEAEGDDTPNEDAAIKAAEAEGKRFLAKNKGMAATVFVDAFQSKNSLDILIIILDGEKNDKRMTQKWAETHMIPALQKKFPDNTFTLKNVKTGNLAAHGGERLEQFTLASEMEFDIIVS